MSTNIIYLIILVLYFIAILFLGGYFNKKVSSDEEYFLAKGKLGGATIGFSYSATQMSGSTYMGAVGACSILGYNFIPAALASASAPWFSYTLIGERILKVSSKLKSITLCDILEERYYSKKAGLLSTIIMLISFIPLIAAQLKAAANSFEVILGIPYLTGLVIFGGIVIIYTILGGMYAVAWTDLIQGIIMIAGFAILTPVAVSAAGGFSQMHLSYAQINPGGIKLVGTMPALWVVSSLFVWGFFQIGGSPASITRFLIPKDQKTLRKAMIYSVLFQSFIYLTFAMVAISGRVLLPKLEQSDLLVPTLLVNYMNPILGGIVLAAALGAMMSTIDSLLLVAGSLVSNNIYNKYFKKSTSDLQGVKLGRIVTLIIGIFALIIAINPPAAILWIVTMSFSLMASAFTFPLLLGFWWPGATREGGIAGIIGGAVGCIVWYILGYLKYQSFSNWIGGIWPAIFGGVVSLALLIIVSKISKPIPNRVIDIFFDDIIIEG